MSTHTPTEAFEDMVELWLAKFAHTTRGNYKKGSQHFFPSKSPLRLWYYRHKIFVCEFQEMHWLITQTRYAVRFHIVRSKPLPLVSHESKDNARVHLNLLSTSKTSQFFFCLEGILTGKNVETPPRLHAAKRSGVSVAFWAALPWLGSFPVLPQRATVRAPTSVPPSLGPIRKPLGSVPVMRRTGRACATPVAATRTPRQFVAPETAVASAQVTARRCRVRAEPTKRVRTGSASPPVHPFQPATLPVPVRRARLVWGAVVAPMPMCAARPVWPLPVMPASVRPARGAAVSQPARRSRSARVGTVVFRLERHSRSTAAKPAATPPSAVVGWEVTTALSVHASRTMAD